MNQTQCSDQAIGGTFVILFEKLHRWLIIYNEFNVTVNQPLLVNNILLFFCVIYDDKRNIVGRT